LHVFLEVVKQRNFTKAARNLHMSQPAISQSIAALEKRLGTRIIERTNKGVQLNKAGQIVFIHAKDILRNYEQMEILVSDLINEPQGVIKIGASYTIGEYVLPNIFIRLRENYPVINPHIKISNTKDIGESLLNHEIDIGLIEGDFSHLSIKKENFTFDELFVFGHKDINIPRDKDERQMYLNEMTWIIREEGSGTRYIAMEFLKKCHLQPKTILEFGSTQLIKEAIEAGIGLSLLSKWVIKKEQALGTVCQLNIPETPMTRTFSLITCDQEFIPGAVKAFKETVLNYFPHK